MKHFLPPIIVFSIMFSACATVPNNSEPTALATSTPGATSIPSLTPTLTPKPLPAATATPTLPPDPNTYQFDSNVTPFYRDLTNQAVQLGRYWLLNNLGSDVSKGVNIIVVSHRPQQREGFVDYPPGSVPYLYFDTPGWDTQGCTTTEFRFRCSANVVGELTLYWMREHGCYETLFYNSSYHEATFLVGLEGYAGFMAAGTAQDALYMNSATAAELWPIVHYDQNNWFNAGDVAQVAVKRLIDQHGTMAFTQFCDAVGRGTNPYDAFQSTFGISIQDFRAKFMDDVLGDQKNCTQTTCGAASLGATDPRYGSMTPMIDYSLKSPNLVIKITDQQGKPVPDINYQLFRRLYNNFYADTEYDAPTTNSDGVLSVPVLPGTYGMTFCAAGYPAHGAAYSMEPTKCVYELNLFEIMPGEIKTIDFQYWDINDHTLAAPNFLFTLLGVNGQPVGSQYVQVCGYDAVSTVCLNGQTDQSGVFRASLKAGTYLVRLVQAGQGYTDPRGYSNPTYAMNLDPYHGTAGYEYEIRGIQIEDPGVKSITYQFAAPNLLIKFSDANGSPTPNIYFFLCKSTDVSLSGPSQQDVTEKQITMEMLARFYGKSWDTKKVKAVFLDGNCFLRDHTDKSGIFQLHVDPGKYFIFFLNPGVVDFEYYFDHVLSDIAVSDNQVTTVSAQFK
jgi:hypothetical protein